MSFFVSRFGGAMGSFVVALACTKPPVVADSSAGTSASGGSQGSLSGGDARGGLIRRGQTFDGVLSRNESHDYQIDLRARESIHIDVVGASEFNAEGQGCGSWEWSWLNPSNEWVNGNPGPTEDQQNRSEPRSMSIDLRADDAPAQGRWTFRLRATEHCANRLRYRIALR